tara:strand:- start:300187 stop:302040 length:1854 start_codon:yes stop_codon:yes gene_type:complete
MGGNFKIIQAHLRFALLLLGLAVSLGLHSQNQLDSLRTSAENEKDPKLKVTKELSYLNTLMSYHPDSAIYLIDSLINRYQKEEFNFAHARCLSLKAWFLVFKSQYEESHRIGHQALEMQRKENTDSMGIGLSLNRIGIANLQFGKLDEAEKYMKEALEYFDGLGDKRLLEMVLNNLGICATEKMDYQAGINYYSQSLEIRKERKSWFWVAYSYYNIGNLYLENQKIDSAEKYYDLSLKTFQEKTKSGAVPPMIYMGIGDLKFKQKDFPNAIKNYIKTIEGSEAKGHTELIVQTQVLLSEAYFENGDFEMAFKTLKEYNANANALDSINDISKVSEIEEKYKNAEKEVEIIRLKSEELEARNRAQKSNMLALGIAILALFAFSSFYFIIKRRKQKESLKESELNNKISDMKLVALRSQMNPHFIFNCINTAQNFVLDSKKEDAYDYLSKFAKLLRIVLENSDQTFISLEDEINHLKLYIELEQIRFERNFQFYLEVDQELENGVFEIPSMMIQAFVENSILHGLMNKNEGERELKIIMKKEGEMLNCIIEDNGVGREKAMEIKQQKKKFYKGTALPNIEERLLIIEKNTGLNIDLKIEDLFENLQAKGTRVNLRLPLS